MGRHPVNLNVHPEIESFFDPQTNTISYVVVDPGSKACAMIDSVMDIDYAAGRITYEHADHLSAAPYIQSKLGGRIGIGDRVTVV